MPKTKLETLKENYEKARKKYSLPNFDDFEKEFELSKYDRHGNIINEMRRAIGNKLHWYSELLEPILNPQQQMLSMMVESKIFEKEDKKPISNLYKHIWTLLRKGVIAALGDEKENAEFVMEVWKENKKIKEQIRKYAEFSVKGWQKEEEKENSEGYFG